MRVISGSARRLVLETPDNKVRPTTDRTKETLFNIINNDVNKAIVLDLFAGSGALGIECLSRGATKCYFIDDFKESIEIITKNLKHTKLIDQSVVLQYDYKKALNEIDEKLDLIFLDPPYNNGFESEALNIISENNMLNENGVIVVEASLETNIICPSKLREYKIKKYKTNKHIFYKTM